MNERSEPAPMFRLRFIRFCDATSHSHLPEAVVDAALDVDRELPVAGDLRRVGVQFRPRPSRRPRPRHRCLRPAGKAGRLAPPISCIGARTPSMPPPFGSACGAGIAQAGVTVTERHAVQLRIGRARRVDFLRHDLEIVDLHSFSSSIELRHSFHRRLISDFDAAICRKTWLLQMCIEGLVH